MHLSMSIVFVNLQHPNFQLSFLVDMVSQSPLDLVTGILGLGLCLLLVLLLNRQLISLPGSRWIRHTSLQRW